MSILSRIARFFASLLRPNPARDWFFALIVTLVLFVCLVSYAGYEYVSINSGAAFAGAQQETAPVLSVTRADVESVLEAYRTRSVNYAAHNLPSPAVTDPASLLETKAPKQ